MTVLKLLKSLVAFALCIGVNYPVAAAQATDMDALIKSHSKKIESVYQWFHQNPELSFKEEKTAKKLASELENLGFKVTEGIGGTGLVAILKNGKGPTAMIRADMDALPVSENTGVSFASKEKNVMHACAHDIHMASLIGVGQVLYDLRKEWSGTLILIGQPAEELGKGAFAMLEDGLLRKFPRPDYVLGLHNSPDLEVGFLGLNSGYQMAAVDSIDITVFGKDTHGAAPHLGIDPIVLSAQMILAFQGLVSRVKDPTKTAVLTVGSIHGGIKHNIIPNEVKLQLTLRTYEKEVREQMLAGIRKITKHHAEAAGAKAPSVKLVEGVPALYNTPKLVSELKTTFAKEFGEKRIVQFPPVMYGEDFSYFLEKGKIPSAYFFVGARPKGKKEYPPAHNARYIPDYKNTLPIAIKAMSHAFLQLQQKEPKD